MTFPPTRYSAVLTTYNSEKNVLAALSAICNQDIPPFEIIIVDDFSTDGTVRLIQDFAFSEITIRVVLNRSNAGQSESRNTALGLASSPIAIFFDDDDISLPERSTFHLELHSNGAEISYVSSIKNYGNAHEVVNLNTELQKICLDTADACALLFAGIEVKGVGSLSVPASTLGVSVESFKALGGFDTKLRRLEDVDFFLRATRKGIYSSWTKRIGVIRAHSIRDDKGRGIDSDYELMLLERYSDFMSRILFREAVLIAKLRQMYFSRKLSALPLFLFSNPRAIILILKRVAKLMRRLIHDLKKNRK
jgi:glycosyltransferase involved in cell wall biosynthesis